MVSSQRNYRIADVGFHTCRTRSAGVFRGRALIGLFEFLPCGTPVVIHTGKTVPDQSVHDLFSNKTNVLDQVDLPSLGTEVGSRCMRAFDFSQYLNHRYANVIQNHVLTQKLVCSESLSILLVNNFQFLALQEYLRVSHHLTPREGT